MRLLPAEQNCRIHAPIERDLPAIRIAQKRLACIPCHSGPMPWKLRVFLRRAIIDVVIFRGMKSCREIVMRIGVEQAVCARAELRDPHAGADRCRSSPPNVPSPTSLPSVKSRIVCCSLSLTCASTNSLIGREFAHVVAAGDGGMRLQVNAKNPLLIAVLVCGRQADMRGLVFRRAAIADSRLQHPIGIFRLIAELAFPIEARVRRLLKRRRLRQRIGHHEIRTAAHSSRCRRSASRNCRRAAARFAGACHRHSRRDRNRSESPPSKCLVTRTP